MKDDNIVLLEREDFSLSTLASPAHGDILSFQIKRGGSCSAILVSWPGKVCFHAVISWKTWCS